MVFVGGTFNLLGAHFRQSGLSVTVTITIDIMLNFDSDFDKHEDGNVTCKWTLNLKIRGEITDFLKKYVSSKYRRN